MVAAQQRISGLVEPVMVGGICIAIAVFSPWIVRPLSWFNVALGLCFGMGGGLFVAAGVGGWRPGGRALVFTPSGIQWTTGMIWNPFRSGVACIPWNDIADARFVRWKDREDDENVAVILELAAGAQNQLGAKWSKIVSKEIEKHIGLTVAENIVFFHNDKWEWDAERVADQINTSVKNVAVRASWGAEDQQP